jgi:hypothetical protein
MTDRPRAISHQPSGIGHRASAIGHQPSAIGHRASGIGHRASGIGHRPSGIGHRASAIGHSSIGPSLRACVEDGAREPRTDHVGASHNSPGHGLPRPWPAAFGSREGTPPSGEPPRLREHSGDRCSVRVRAAPRFLRLRLLKRTSAACGALRKRDRCSPCCVRLRPEVDTRLPEPMPRQETREKLRKSSVFFLSTGGALARLSSTSDDGPPRSLDQVHSPAAHL